MLDRQGRFFHDGERVAHRGLHKGFASWVATHPDDGRFILTNGYDWCYFTVEDTPYFITALTVRDGTVVVTLFDDTTEDLDLESLQVDDDDVLRARVKQGRFEARFSRHAQLALAPLLADDGLTVVVDGRRHAITATSPRPSGSSSHAG